MKLKIVTLLSICIASVFSSSAQIRLDPFYPYSAVTVGVGVGTSQLYGNLSNSNSEAMLRVNVDKNFGPWISLGLEGQHGGLSDYESKNHWTSGLSEYNTISAVDLNAKLCLGSLFNAPRNFFGKTVFGLYVGVGGGYMWNDVSSITLKYKHQDALLITDINSANIKTNTGNFFIPFSIGFDLHITRRCMFNVNYQFSYAFSDYLDGYNFQGPTVTNKYNDMFSVLSFGLHFYVGRVGNGKVAGTYRTRHN